MRRTVQKTPTRARSRKKLAVIEEAPAPTPALTPTRNVGAVEALLSLTFGVLLLVKAVVPNSIRQLLLLTVGAALVHRGMTSQSRLYKALGIDSEKAPLLPQIRQRLESVHLD